MNFTSFRNESCSGESRMFARARSNASSNVGAEYCMLPIELDWSFQIGNQLKDFALSLHWPLQSLRILRASS